MRGTDLGEFERKINYAMKKSLKPFDIDIKKAVGPVKNVLSVYNKSKSDSENEQDWEK